MVTDRQVVFKTEGRQYHPISHRERQSKFIDLFQPQPLWLHVTLHWPSAEGWHHVTGGDWWSGLPLHHRLTIVGVLHTHTADTIRAGMTVLTHTGYTTAQSIKE